MTLYLVLVQKIKIALQKKHDELVSKNKKSSAAFMKRLVEQIKSAEDLKVVENFYK
jgi:hypothetical protein